MKKTFTDELGKKWDVTITTKLVKDRQEIVSVKVKTTDSAPVTRRVLASISLEELLRDEIASISPILKKSKTRKSHQGKQHTEDDLREVAKIYNAARKARFPVQKAVADAQGISVSTATKRIMAARKADLLS
jgi:hypothetical protein